MVIVTNPTVDRVLEVAGLGGHFETLPTNPP